MKTRIIQLDISWENIDGNIDQVSQEIGDWKGDLLVLPEMWSTGFTMSARKVAETMEGKAVQAMQQWSRQTGALVMGSLVIQEGSDYYNRCVITQPGGELRTYDKRHLFSYAREQEHYTGGSQNELINLDSIHILPQICYDLRFPIAARYSDEQNYHVLVYVANWPARRSYAWNQLLRARAIENQSYVIGVNRRGLDGNGIYYSGDSVVVDFSGKEVLHLFQNDAVGDFTLDMEELEKFRRNFPFLEDRDIR